jgi:hypothetical protein
MKNWRGISSTFNANLLVANADDPNLFSLQNLPPLYYQQFGWRRYTFWVNRRAKNVGGITASYSTNTVYGMVYNGGLNQAN